MIQGNWITNRLMVGSAPLHGIDYMDLKAAGITHVVDMRWEADSAAEQEETRTHGLFRFHYPIFDGPGLSEGDLRLALQEAIHRCVNILATNPTNKIYLHCAAGISRSATVACGVLTHFGHSLAWSRAFLKQRRPCTDPHPILWDALEKLMGSDVDRVLL